MNSTRRDFLTKTALAGTGLAAASLLRGNATGAESVGGGSSSRQQTFNMCGYAAPKLEKIRVGLIGIGNRGSGAIPRLKVIEGVEIKALCDLRPERVEEGLRILNGGGRRSKRGGDASPPKQAETTYPAPATYSGGDEDWKRVCERDDLDVIYNCTPWPLHAPISVYAMEHGKHAFSEIPAAVHIDQCWQLVETSERTKKHYMMLEN